MKITEKIGLGMIGVLVPTAVLTMSFSYAINTIWYAGGAVFVVGFALLASAAKDASKVQK